MPDRRFTGRKEHRHQGRTFFAEVTVRAGPCSGESEAILSEGVLNTFRETFGPDFEHQRDCVRAAVAVQMDSMNVAGEMPPAGATSSRAEVVEVRVSGDAGREISGFLLTVAGMDAIGCYLVEWEVGQPGPAVEAADRRPEWGEVNRGRSVSGTPDPGRSGVGTGPAIGFVENLTEDDLIHVAYQTTYIMAITEINSGSAEEEIRCRHEPSVKPSGSREDAAREALDDALAGRPMRDKARPRPAG